MSGEYLSHKERDKLNELGKTIRALRLAKKYSQRVLAAKAQVHRNTIYRLEKTPDMVNLYAIDRVAIALDTKLWRLIKFVDQTPVTTSGEGL